MSSPNRRSMSPSPEYGHRLTSPAYEQTRDLIQGLQPGKKIPYDLLDYMSSYAYSSDADPYELVKEGNLFSLDTLHEEQPLDKTDVNYVMYAVSFGQADILEWLLDNKFRIPDHILTIHPYYRSFFEETFRDWDDEWESFSLNILEFAWLIDPSKERIMNLLYTNGVRIKDPWDILLRRIFMKPNKDHIALFIRYAKNPTMLRNKLLRLFSNIERYRDIVDWLNRTS